VPDIARLILAETQKSNAKMQNVVLAVLEEVSEVHNPGAV
jgi:hypothetical protein